MSQRTRLTIYDVHTEEVRDQKTLAKIADRCGCLIGQKEWGARTETVNCGCLHIHKKTPTYIHFLWLISSSDLLKTLKLAIDLMQWSFVKMWDR